MNLPAAWAKALLASRLYPAVFQGITTAAFLVIVVSALFATNNSGQNVGMALTWAVWWPLLPLSFLLAGRSWCAICPFARVTDLVQQAVGAELAVPRILRRHGPWVIAFLFLLITYVDETWRLSVDARKTGYLLLALLVAVIAFAAFFERRAFCRHVCFIGGFAGNYSRAGIVELRADADRCRGCRARVCDGGTVRVAGCPLFLHPPELGDSATCHLCGNCVKSCARDAVSVGFRPPVSELWNGRAPHLHETVLAGSLVGIVLIEQAALLRAWIPLVEGTGALLHLDPYVWYPLVYAALLTVFAVAPLAGLALAGFASETLSGRQGGSVLSNAVAFSAALIPMALASHLAHAAFHLLTRSRSVPFALLALAGHFPRTVQSAWVSNRAVFGIQMTVLVLGTGASLFANARIARRLAPRSPRLAFLPHAALSLALLAVNVYFALTLLVEKG
jgi:ferredoxin